MKNTIKTYKAELQQALDNLPVDQLEQLSECLYQAYTARKQVFILGNGGSASTATHMAADLAKNTIERHMERFKVMSLNDNMALLTALANDISYEEVFSEQLISLLEEGDILLVISGSGNSPNILRAIECANQKQAKVIGLLGMDGGKAKEICDTSIIIDSYDYGVIEDLHLVINHMLVKYFAERFKNGS